MKFRKVCADGDAAGDGWTVATAETGTACAVKVKSNRRLPLQNNEDMLIEEEREKANDANCPDIMDTVRELNEKPTKQVAVTPKAVKIQHNVEDRRPPSKAVLEFFYNNAMQKNKQEETDKENALTDQKELSRARILSLEDVLLPSIAHQENLALKQIQRKVQRDAPDQTYIVKDARLAVSECLSGALQAVRQSRTERRELEKEREQLWAEERQTKREEEREKRQEDRETRRAEEAKLKEIRILREKRELKKKLPFNQDLYREVAFLMTESSNLAKEERLWKEAEEILSAREKETETKEAKKDPEKEASEDVTMESSTTDNDTSRRMETYTESM